MNTYMCEFHFSLLVPPLHGMIKSHELAGGEMVNTLSYPQLIQTQVGIITRIVLTIPELDRVRPYVLESVYTMWQWHHWRNGQGTQ